MNSTSFLPLIDGSNGLPKLMFVKPTIVESTVFEIIGGGGGGVSSNTPPFVQGVGTKYVQEGLK